MNDQEVIQLLRDRLHTVETAIHDFMDVLERTGKQRENAYQTAVGIREMHPSQSVTTRQAIDGFFLTYERTMPERQEAAMRLREALTTDFRTAVLTGHDCTEEQRERWLREEVISRLTEGK